ncbi:MAG: hypothetical protein MRY83_07025, partial [Flavobacteriales bacterium]|nr:hypothetical protein [Flavobacteriales bacterium]
MKYIIVILILSPLIGFTNLSSVQIQKVDSIRQLLAHNQNDTTTINLWRAWDNLIYRTNTELDIRLNEQIDSL